MNYDDGSYFAQLFLSKIPKTEWIIYVRTLVMIKFDCCKIEHTKYESPFLKTRSTNFRIYTAHDTVGSGHLSPGSSDWRRAWSAWRSPLSWTPAPLEKPPLVCGAVRIPNKKRFQFLWIEQHKWHVARRGAFEATCLNQKARSDYHISLCHKGNGCSVIKDFGTLPLSFSTSKYFRKF